MQHQVEPPPPPRARRRSFARTCAVGLAVTYTVALVVVSVLLRFVGEGWWVTTAGLYLPRIGFALPLPLVALALALAGPRKLLWLLPAPVLVLLFPLMGLRVGLATSLSLLGSAHAARGGLRLVSFNIASADHPEAVALAIADAKPDLVLLQEWDDRAAEPLFAALPGFHRHLAGQFGVFSRYPISEVFIPPRIDLPGAVERSARFVRYTIATPLGVTAVFNMHPVSPRNGLEDLRSNGVLDHLRYTGGGGGRREGITALRTNAVLRWRQAEAVAESASTAARDGGPVIIAGDTNLPGLSRIFAQTLAAFRDGWSEAGRGFGYTFPAHRPWMRIDRILASGPVAFTRFQVLPASGSDHLAVVTDLSPSRDPDNGPSRASDR